MKLSYNVQILFGGISVAPGEFAAHCSRSEHNGILLMVIFSLASIFGVTSVLLVLQGGKGVKCLNLFIEDMCNDPTNLVNSLLPFKKRMKRESTFPTLVRKINKKSKNNGKLIQA